MRATHDAVVVGSGTAVADNPRLDVRLEGLETATPVRVVLDGRLRLPLTHDLVIRASACATWLFTRTDADPARRRAYEAAGVTVIPVDPGEAGDISLTAVLQALGARGLTRVLVEGGGRLAAGLLRADLVDRMVWFRAPQVIGGDGTAAIAGFGVARLAEARRFALVDVARLGDDVVESYVRAL